jgi:RNA polymerase sigma-70 factor (ECF subfamily)
MDNEAFKKRIIQLQPGLQKVAENILNDADRAADAVQDTVLKIWDNRRRMNRVSNLEGYCVTAVKRRCIDLLREQQPSVPIDEEAFMLADTTFDESFEERYRQARALIDQLPVKQREIILMKYEQEMPNAEIEKALQISSTNLYTILSRAYKSLREAMDREKPQQS